MFKLLKRAKSSLVYPPNNTFDLLFNIRIDLLISCAPKCHMIFIIIPYFYGFIPLRISFIVMRVLTISLGSLEIRCALLYSIVNLIFYFVSHFTIFLPLLSLCISVFQIGLKRFSSSFAALHKCSQVFSIFSPFFLPPSPPFPFFSSIYSHVFFCESRKYALIMS